MSGSRGDLIEDLAADLPRARLLAEVQSALGVTADQTREIVQAFDRVVARPLEENLRRFRGKDLIKRNPLIYTTRGTYGRRLVERVLADRETSPLEGGETTR